MPSITQINIEGVLSVEFNDPLTPSKEVNLNDRLTLTKAVKLITPRVKGSDDDTRQAENRIRHRITYAVKTGCLTKETDGNFTLANVVFWGSVEWPGKFNDLPNLARADGELPMMTCNASMSGPMPNSIEECHSLLKTAQQRIATLENEIFDLKPDAEKYRTNCKKNKSNAKMKRDK